MSDTSQDRAGVVAPPPLIYAGALIIGLLLQRAFPITLLPRPIARTIGACLIAINFLIAIPAVLAMRRAHTNLNPMLPTTAIVTNGPYRYSRNPIYLSFTLLYAGIAIFTNALWALLLLPGVLVVMVRGVITREERYLQRKFGVAYLEYMAQVRRWL